MGWQIPRLPGLGDMQWPWFVAWMYGSDHDGTVSIEDRALGNDVALVKRGLSIGRDLVRPQIH